MGSEIVTINSFYYLSLKDYSYIKEMLKENLLKVSNHYWPPIPQIQEYVRSSISQDEKKIVDVGAGYSPLEFSTDIIDYLVYPEFKDRTVHKVDICREEFPFPENTFDYAYCRHTIEDIFDPEFTLQEIRRIAKRGWIETPSSLIEILRGVDGEFPDWRGYHHHRYILWHKDNTYHILPKYPIIEYIDFKPEFEKKLIQIADSNPFFWNNYFEWNDTFEIKLYQHDVDYKIMNDYANLLVEAVTVTVENTNQFLEKLKQ
jgi:SAM-dependent methyltransferase